MDRFKKISITAAGFLLAASFAFADEAGRFVSVEGRVDLLKAGAAESVAACADDIISAGDIVRTKGRSKAEIIFSDNSSLKIMENSRVQIKEYNIENGKRTRGAILVERGGVRATVSKTSGKNDLIIDTPNATGSVKGTDLFVSFRKSATNVLVVNGKFSAANLAFPEKVVNITSGNAAFIPADEPPQAPREYLALEKSSYEVLTEEAMAEGYSEPGEMKAKITAVSGNVRVRSRGSITWHDAKVNELLSAGDTIETKDNGKIEIRLDNGNVIDLKPDSKLVLQKLTQDTKSGDYQNLFESSQGRLRAKVSKLKGDSKFEIKTPTALAAVRGTTMFLNILPDRTNAYFEDGNGSLKNLFSNVTKTVPGGMSAYAESNGKISEPAAPSDAERSGFTGEWIQEGTGGDTGYNGGDVNVNTGNTSDPPVDDPIRIEDPPPPPPPPPPPVSNDWNGTFSGNITGNFSGTLSGQYSRPNNQNWGSWRSDSSGTYGSVGAWSALMVGSGYDQYSDLYWAGTMSATPGGGTISATEEGVALYGLSLGKMSGSSTGVYTGTGPGTWSTHDTGTFAEIVNLTTTLGITGINLAGNGRGDSLSGTLLMVGLFGGETVESTPSTGTFSGILAGTGSAGSPWKLALGLTSHSAGAVDAYSLATADNSGVYHCVYFGEPWSSTTFTVGKATGSIGAINIVDTTWNANVTSGNWVDLAVLDTILLGFTQATLSDFVSVPITETYTSLLTGSGSFTAGGLITGVNMDISMYAKAASDTSGIWTSLISGNYTGTTSPTWSASVDSGNVILTGTQWSGNQWAATVSGTVNSSTITGEAGGTYDSSTLTGVGAGTWQP